ncbi:MAG: citramalate synthase [Planctomycetes bacterium]|nr:citramalate synthase [Planctomycetota bacterium]
MIVNNTKKKIEIYDTTLRDGTQSEGISLSLEDKLLIASALDGLGVDYIEGGYPLSNPKDAAFFTRIKQSDLKNARLTAFGMTRRKGVKPGDDVGLKALLDSEAPAVMLVGKSWDMHVAEVIKTSNDENLVMIAESVEFIAARGREVLFDAEHFFDGYQANPDYAMATLRAAADAGASCLILCDTNGGACLETVAQVTKAVAQAFGNVRIGIHCHDDCNLATANSLIAVNNGAVHVQGTINGLGERCGNADLTAVIGNLVLKHGYDCLRPGTLASLTEVSRFVYEVANLNLRANQAFVGSGAFAHKGGMHVHAVRCNTSTYEHIDPGAVGNVRRILVSELSGSSNIAAQAPAKFNIAQDKDAQRRVLQALIGLENEGYQFEAAEASFEMLIRKTLGGQWYHPLWRLDHYRCMIFKETGSAANTEAIIKLHVNNSAEHTVSAGDGPVDSLHEALCAALRKHYPEVDDLHLIDYKVRVVNTAAETAAKVRVVIDWRDAIRQVYFGSVGVSENIIEASWLALSDAVEYKLLNSAEAASAATTGADTAESSA